MTTRTDEIAGLLVQGRGSKRSLIAGVAGGQALGVLGSIAGRTGAARKGKNGQYSPLAVGQTGYLAVLPESVTLFGTQGGLARKAHASDIVIASIPRTATASARLNKGRVSGDLEIGFTDGSAWAFDVARTDYAKADQVAGAIAPGSSPLSPAAAPESAAVWPPTAASEPPPVSMQTQPSPPPDSPPAGRWSWWSRMSKGRRIALIVVAFFVVFGVLGMLGVGEEEKPAADNDTTEEAVTEESPTVDVPAGFELIENEDAGFTIALPEGFEQFEPGSAELDDLFDELAAANPALAQSRSVFDESGVAYAIDLTSDADFKPTMNLLKFAGSPGDLADAEESVGDTLESIGARLVASDLIELPAGEALRVESAMPIANGDGASDEMQTVQYIIPANGSTFVVNLSSGDMAVDRATFDQIIETLRVTK